MATFSLNSYILDLLRNNRSKSNEIYLDSKDQEFDLYSLYVERPNTNIDSIAYRTDTANLVYCLQGQAELTINGCKLKLSEGNVVFLKPEVKYYLKILSPQSILMKFKMKPRYNWHNDFIGLHLHHSHEKELIQLFMNSMKQKGYVHFKNTSVMMSSQIFNQLIQEYINGTLFMWITARHFFSLALFFSLRTQMFSLEESEKKRSDFENRLLDDYIDAHYNDISLDKAAKYFGFNKNYFSSLVKDKTGKSFVDHVDERRMVEAKRLLSQPNISLFEIVNRVGYSSKSFFYKKFNRYYGMTPAAMRKKLFEAANINLK